MPNGNTILVAFAAMFLFAAAAALSGLMGRKTINLMAMIFLMTFIVLFHERFPFWWADIRLRWLGGF